MGGRDDADFESYLAARWPVIEATLLRIGCPERLVVPVAVRGLRGARRSWTRVRRDDADVCVLGDVLRETRSQVGTLRDVRDALAEVVGLRDDQIERVLDLLARPTWRHQLVATSQDALPAGRPSVRAIAEDTRALRRRRVRAWPAVVGAIVVVAVAVAWPEGESADVVWYANGVLHGDGFVLEVPDARQLLRLDDGTAYVDARGGIHRVDRHGRQHRIGASVAGAAATASPEGNLVAWIERRPGERGRVVVYDVVKDRTVDTMDLEAHPELTRAALPRLRLLALNGRTLYFAIGDDDFAWELGDRDVRAEGTGLVDVAAATEARVQGEHVEIQVDTPFADSSHTIVGSDAAISPDGGFVLTSTPTGVSGAATDRPRRVRLHDAVSGQRMPTGLARDALVLDAAFGPGPSITYLVVPARDPASGSEVEVRPLVILRTCELPEVTCRDRGPFDPGAAAPLLAQ